MSINQVPANRYPHASAPVKQGNNPTAEIVKHKERSSWEKPVYSTALAVAAIGAVYFAYHSGIFSSLFSPPPVPQPTTPQLSPSRQSSQSTNNSAIANVTVSTSSQPPPPHRLTYLEIQKEIQKLQQQLQALYIQNSHQKNATVITMIQIFEKTLGYGLYQKEDCPDRETTCPLPRVLCEFSDSGDRWDCSTIDAYEPIILRLKEDCTQVYRFVKNGTSSYHYF